MINDVFKIVVSRIKEKPFDTYADIGEEVPLNLNGDPTRLRQILVNLLSNALKFTSEGEIGVIVRGKKEADAGSEYVDLHFVVKDTGVGIPEHRLASIFESFSPEDKGEPQKFERTGLGLPHPVCIQAQGAATPPARDREGVSRRGS